MVRIRGRRSGAPPLVSVIFDPGHDADLRAASLATLEAQTHPAWELVTAEAGVLEALGQAAGRYVAFLDAGDTWDPGRLQRLAAVLESGHRAVADEIEGARGDGTRVALRTPPPEVEPARLVVEREVLEDAGVDPSAGAAWPLDLLLRHPDVEVASVAEAGVRREFRARRRALAPAPGNWRNAVLNRHLVDWAALEAAEPTPGLTSVLVPTYEDYELTTACVESLMAARDADGSAVEVIVWDNGSVPEVASALDSLTGRFEDVAVRHAEENYGFALGNNLALARAHGDVVVFLNNDTTVPPGWLTPLRSALQDPGVLGVQPLLIYPTGSIQSAGVVFPSTGGLPHAFLQGFPVEDATGIDSLGFQALTGAALALRCADAIRLRGFDPVFTNGMEDVDLCHRLAELRSGRFSVRTGAPVVHHESRSPGRYDKHLANRAIYLDRWRARMEPRDDVEMWATRGLRVVDHEVAPRRGEERRLSIPRPVLVRDARLVVREGPPRLRWAVKNAAPAGEGGQRWGDTHFAAGVAAALRGLGQEVVVDRRPEWSRATGRHDDVALVLRGLVAHDPSPEQVSLAWVISHPDDVTAREARSYDRVAAASRSWAALRSKEWGLRIEPLLQATDPSLFHPDRGESGSGHPVLFVGNSRRRLRPVVRDAIAAGLPVAVYGDLWSGLVPDEVVAGRSVPNDELAAAYRGAGVVLNDHWDDMQAGGFVSNRLFDAVASGARVISDDVQGLSELFGTSVQVYEAPEELARLATLADPDQVFGDDDTRRATAARIHREHSFASRAERLLELAVEARRDRGFSS